MKAPVPSDPSVTALPTRPQPRTKPRFKFRTTEASVANYVARIVILNYMDFEKAVIAIEPRLETLEIDRIAKDLQSDPNIQSAIEKQMSAKDLGEKSKEIFVEEIWNRFWNGGGKDKEIATRVLAKAFIAEKVEVEKPEELPIQGFDEGIRQMLAEVKTDGALPEVK